MSFMHVRVRVSTPVVVSGVAGVSGVTGVAGVTGENAEHRYEYWCIFPILLLFVLAVMEAAVVDTGAMELQEVQQRQQ